MVVAEERNARVVRPLVQRVDAEERRLVLQPQQAEHGRCDVDLRHQRVDLARRDVLRRVDHQRNLVGLERNLGLAVDARTVIGDHDEDRVVEPGLLGGLAQEIAERVVGVAHARLAAAALGLDAFLLEARTERERLVVRRRHDDREERLAGLVLLAEVLDRAVEQVFVGDAPDVLEADLVDVGAVEHLEAVAREERVHVVEVAVAAVEEAALVAEVVHDLAPAADALVARPAQDRDGRDRRERRGDRFEAAHGARAGRVGVGEPEPLLRVGVEVRRPVLVRAVQLAELGAERLARHDDDVELAEAVGPGGMQPVHLAQRQLRERRAVGRQFRLAAAAGCPPAWRCA